MSITWLVSDYVSHRYHMDCILCNGIVLVWFIHGTNTIA